MKHIVVKIRKRAGRNAKGFSWGAYLPDGKFLCNNNKAFPTADLAEDHARSVLCPPRSWFKSNREVKVER